MSLSPSLFLSLLLVTSCLSSAESSFSSFSQTLRHRLCGDLPELKSITRAASEIMPSVITLTKWFPDTWHSLGGKPRAERSMQEASPEDSQEYAGEGFKEVVEEDVKEASGQVSDGSCTDSVPSSIQNAKNYVLRSMAARVCKGNMKKAYGALNLATVSIAVLDYSVTHKYLSRAIVLVNECIAWGNTVEGGDLQVAGTIITTAISCLATKLKSQLVGEFRKPTRLKSVIIDRGSEPIGNAALGNYDLTYFKNGTGTRVYSKPGFSSGVFSANIRCPSGNTTGVLTSFFLATNYADPYRSSIVFEMRGEHRNLGMIQTIENGVTSARTAVDLGYDCADSYHLYSIYWTPKMILWMSDSNVIHMYDKATWYAPVPSGSEMHLYFGIEAIETYTMPTWQKWVDLGTKTDSITASFKNVTIRSPLLTMPKINRKAVKAPMLTMATDYCGDHMSFERSSSSANIMFDNVNCGGRFHSGLSYFSGEFTTKFKCADGNTSGLLPSFYLSSREGTIDQDEIDFEWIGYNKRVVQTNYFVNGKGGHELWLDLGFDCSTDFHTYTIRWSPVSIRWFVDSVLRREVFKSSVQEYPVKPLFLYASIWNASGFNFGSWSGVWDGKDVPFVYQYRNIQITSPVK